MDLSTENKILNKIKKAKRGSLFFIENFIDFGSSKSINKALERLVEKEEIVRVARGIYTRPKISKLIGAIQPTADEIAKAIAKRDKARIIPTGAYALNILGLSKQVPLNIVYLTDGSSRKINIGKQSIVFKKTSPKNLATIGEISSLVIQALKTIGNDNLKEWELQKILELLGDENLFKLKHDIRLAPEWIRKIMKKALKDNGSN